jgi:hypothetical protein
VIERYLVVAGRIREEIADLERTVSRSGRAMNAAKANVQDQDIYLDSVALNLHDFYTGLERIFQQIAALVDRSMPEGPEWHRELLRQLATDLPHVRPRVLSKETVKALDEYLRFRHVVRNIYAFEFDFERIDRLIQGLKTCFENVKIELFEFAEFLEKLAND